MRMKRGIDAGWNITLDNFEININQTYFKFMVNFIKIEVNIIFQNILELNKLLNIIRNKIAL